MAHTYECPPRSLTTVEPKGLPLVGLLRTLPSMLQILLIALLAYGAFRLSRWAFAKKRSGGANVGTSPLDTWTKLEVARLVAAKLTIDEGGVTRALDGDPDPDTVASLERGVRKAEVLFERVPGALGGEAFDVTIEVSFEDGSTARSMRRAASVEAPESVREEFKTSGTARVYRPFVFDWRR